MTLTHISWKSDKNGCTIWTFGWTEEGEKLQRTTFKKAHPSLMESLKRLRNNEPLEDLLARLHIDRATIHQVTRTWNKDHEAVYVLKLSLPLNRVDKDVEIKLTLCEMDNLGPGFSTVFKTLETEVEEYLNAPDPQQDMFEKGDEVQVETDDEIQGETDAEAEEEVEMAMDEGGKWTEVEAEEEPAVEPTVEVQGDWNGHKEDVEMQFEAKGMRVVREE